MCQLSQGISMLYLLLLSILDMRFRKMPVWLLITGGMAASGYQIWKGIGGDVPSIALIIAGATVGILFLGVSKITKEALGYGDGIVIFIMGIYLGFWNLATVLMIAFFAASILSLFLLISKKSGRKMTMPFVPFLCIGYAMFILME